MIKNISMICYSLAIAFAMDADAMGNPGQQGNGYQIAKGGRFQNVAEVNVETQQLIAACLVDDMQQIMYCIQQGAEVNIAVDEQRTPLMYAALRGNDALVEFLLQPEYNTNVNIRDAFGRTALMIATQNGHVGVVDLLLQRHANIEAVSNDGWTALMLAASKGHVGIIDLLVQAGAKIEIEGANGNTALINAAINGHAGAVNRLLLHGANINKGNMAGCTALIAAASRGYLDVVGVILWLDATCINIKNKNGDTALILAVINCHEKVVERLLRYRAKTNIKNDREETAYGIAIRGGNAKIIACFQ